MILNLLYFFVVFFQFEKLIESSLIDHQLKFLNKDIYHLVKYKSKTSKHLLSQKCFQSFVKLNSEFKNGTAWAYKMYDSSNRNFNQLLDGTFLNLGDFEECLNIKVYDSDIIGKYFLVNLVPFDLKNNFTKPEISLYDLRESNDDLEKRLSLLFRFKDLINIKLGLCFPSSCENIEIQNLLNQTFNDFYWKIENSINSQIKESFWSKLESKNNFVKLSFFILISIPSLVIIVSITENFIKHKSKNSDNLLKKFLNCFSLRRNFMKLHFSENTKKNKLVSTNRLVFEIIVNITHIIVFVPLFKASVIYNRIFDWIENSESLFLQVLYSDSYYTGLIILASVTVTLKMFSFIKKNSKGNEIALNILKRMINFWPILIVLISIQICLSMFMNGPLVKELIEPIGHRCEKHWWKNLLFISNFIPLQETCLSYTWTISAELQLYILASLLTYVYINKPNVGLLLNLLLIIVGFVANIYVSFTGLTYPNIISFPFSYQKLYSSIFWSHTNTLVQLNTYFIIFLAFYLRIYKNSFFKLEIISELLITLALFLYFLSTFYTPIIFNVFKFKPSPLINTVYYIYNRSSFSFLASWLILRYYPNGEPSKVKETIKFLSNLIKNFSIKTKNSDKNKSTKEKNLENKKPEESFTENLEKSNLGNVIEENLNDKIKNLENNDEKEQNIFNLNCKNNFCDQSIKNQSCSMSHLKKNKKVTYFEKDNCNLEKRNSINNLDDSFIVKKTKKKRNNLLSVWIKLDKSIYYSHFFNLIYSLLNVNYAQKSDMISTIINIQSKVFWIYPLAYVFHFLIEAPVTNLTSLTIEKLIPQDEKVKQA